MTNNEDGNQAKDGNENPSSGIVPKGDEYRESLHMNENPPRKVSIVPWISVVVVFGICLLWLFQINNFTTPIPERMPKKFSLPAGFNDDITIHYGIEGADELVEENGYRLIEVPLNGIIETSSRIQWGRAVDEFYRDLFEPSPEGDTQERLNFGHIEIHKSGLRGDQNEFFESMKELEYRDPELVERYEANKESAQQKMTAGNFNVGIPAYELIRIRDDID